MNAKTTASTRDFIGKEARYGARNYQPVPVVVDHARDCLVWDVEGREYIDMMGAYSAVSHGHLHPRLVAAAQRQLERVAVTSRAYSRHHAGAVPGEALPPDGLRAGVADEHRRRGGGNRDQVRAALGPSRQGHRRRPGRRSWWPAATSMAAPAPSSAFPASRTTAPASAPSRPASGTSTSATWPACAAAATREHLRRAGRADPGRGRRDRAAARLLRASCATGAAATTSS